MFRSIMSAILVAFALAGCAQIESTIGNAQTAISIVNGTKITQSQLDAGVAAYDTVVLRPYNIYRYSDVAYTVPRRYCTKSAPFTVAAPCAKYSILNELQPILRSVETARGNLQTAVTGCNVNQDQTACSGMPALITAFNSAVSVAKVAATQYGII